MQRNDDLPADIERGFTALDKLLANDELGRELVGILRDGVKLLADKRADNMLLLRREEIKKEKQLIAFVGFGTLIFIAGVLAIAFVAVEQNGVGAFQLLIGVFIGALTAMYRPLASMITKQDKTLR